MEFFKTKDECKQAVNILREAKKHLWVKTYAQYDKHPLERKKYYSEYICDCVDHVAPNDIQAKQITDWISYQIDDYFGFDIWLRIEQGIKIATIHRRMPDEDFLKLQRTRIAWMNWMIKELEAKAKRLQYT